MTSLCIATSYTADFSDIGDYAAIGIETYAGVHGVDTHIDKAMDFTERAASWYCLKVIQKLFSQGYEFVLWIDADAIFVRFDVDIRQLIKPGKDLYIVEHVFTNAGKTSAVPNAGVILIKNSSWSTELINTMWDLTQYTHHPWWENAALIDLLGRKSLLGNGDDTPNRYITDKVSFLPLEWNSLPELCPAKDPIIIHFAGTPAAKRLRDLPRAALRGCHSTIVQLQKNLHNIDLVRDQKEAPSNSVGGLLLRDKCEREKVKIFSCHHFFPKHPYDGKLFQSIVSNIPSGDGVMSDLDGYNIAEENGFAELRHQFYVWKNLSHLYDYVGFEHYRRALFIDLVCSDRLIGQYDDILALRQTFLSDHHVESWDCHDTFNSYLSLRNSFTLDDQDKIEDWLQNFDFVVPRPYSQNIHTQWNTCHPPELWTKIVEATTASRYFSARKCHINFEMQNIYFKNIYIMKKPYFEEYMEFVFDILYELKTVEQFQESRLLAMLAERLFSFYLTQKCMENPLLRICTLPLVSAL